MARTKKTATKDATPVIVRSLDVPSLEKRVYDMDGAKIRNYDLFSLEKRIYDLENGGTPGPTPTSATDIIKRLSGDGVIGSATIKYTGKYVFWLVLDSSYINSYRFKINNEDATTAFASGVLSHANVVEGFGYTYIEVELTKDDVLSWDTQYANRYFIAFNKVEE